MDRRFTSQDFIGEWRNNFRGNVPFDFQFRNRRTIACSNSDGSRSRGSRSERCAGAEGGIQSANEWETKLTILEARVGVEPTNGGFADLSLRPLGYRAETIKYSETGLCLSVLARSLADLTGRHGHDLRSADEARGSPGRRGADIKPRAPLEARHFGELGNDLDMPVVMLAGFLSDGRGVDHQVVSRPVEHDVEARE